MCDVHVIILCLLLAAIAAVLSSYDHSVHCYDATTGASQWVFPSVNVVRSTAIADANGDVYFGSYDHYVFCLDGSTGKERWRYRTDGSVPGSGAIGANSWLYIASDDGKLYAFGS